MFGFAHSVKLRDVEVQDLIRLNPKVAVPPPPPFKTFYGLPTAGIHKPVPPKPVKKNPDAMTKSELIAELECAALRFAALPRARVLAWFQRILPFAAG